MRAKPLALSAAIFALSFTPGSAWDKTGHEAVAEIAAARLTPAAQAAVRDLLGSKDALTGMTDVAAWADKIRPDRGDTAHWHFVDIEIGNDGYDAKRDCDKDDCVVGQINKDVAILKDKTLLQPVRSEALKFLIHFVGDIHQPLHCADNQDKGGNKISIYAGSKKTNLHAIWDNATVGALGKDPTAIATMLSARITPELATAWSASTPEQWATEGFLIAKTKIYAQFPGVSESSAPIVLPDTYPVSVGPITAMQLAKAGVRLAAVLNASLGETGPAEAPAAKNESAGP